METKEVICVDAEWNYQCDANGENEYLDKSNAPEYREIYDVVKTDWHFGRLFYSFKEFNKGEDYIFFDSAHFEDVPKGLQEQITAAFNARTPSRPMCRPIDKLSPAQRAFINDLNSGKIVLDISMLKRMIHNCRNEMKVIVNLNDKLKTIYFIDELVKHLDKLIGKHKK